MSSKEVKIKQEYIDKRTVQRNINKKLISKKEYESYLKSLKDEASDADPVVISDEKPTVELVQTDVEPLRELTS